jgi:hypothetical protein
MTIATATTMKCTCDYEDKYGEIDPGVGGGCVVGTDPIVTDAAVVDRAAADPSLTMKDGRHHDGCHQLAYFLGWTAYHHRLTHFDTIDSC